MDVCIGTTGSAPNPTLPNFQPWPETLLRSQFISCKLFLDRKAIQNNHTGTTLKPWMQWIYKAIDREND